MTAMTLKTLAHGCALAMLLLAPVLARAADDEKPPDPTVADASKGGFTIKSGNNSLTFGTYLQVLVRAEDKELWDADLTGSGDGLEDPTSYGFDIPRLRLSVKGTMWKPWLKYNFSYELSRTSGESSSKVKDAYLEFAAKPMATVRLGQFKVPFSLQQITGDQYTQAPERAITDFFAPARDMGAMLIGVTGSKRFGYNVGLFNGSGESNRQDDESLMYAARVWFDPFGEYLLREGAVDHPEKNIFHVGVAMRGGEVMRGPSTAGVFEDPDDQTAYNLELAWKFRSLFATAEYYTQTTEFANPTVGPDIDSDGYHVQGSWATLSDRLEFGVRYATIDPDNDINDDAITEIKGLVSWYWKGHNLKVYSDFGTIEYEANAPATFNGFTARGRPETATTAGRLASAANQTVSDKQIRIQFQLNY